MRTDGKIRNLIILAVACCLVGTAFGIVFIPLKYPKANYEGYTDCPLDKSGQEILFQDSNKCGPNAETLTLHVPKNIVSECSIGTSQPKLVLKAKLPDFMAHERMPKTIGENDVVVTIYKTDCNREKNVWGNQEYKETWLKNMLEKRTPNGKRIFGKAQELTPLLTKYVGIENEKSYGLRDIYVQRDQDGTLLAVNECDKEGHICATRNEFIMNIFLLSYSYSLKEPSHLTKIRENVHQFLMTLVSSQTQNEHTIRTNRKEK